MLGLQSQKNETSSKYGKVCPFLNISAKKAFEVHPEAMTKPFSFLARCK